MRFDRRHRVPFNVTDAARAIARDKALRLFWAYFVVLGMIVWVFST